MWPQSALQETPSCYCDPVLIKGGKAFSLYRLSRDGKYFTIKVATDHTGGMGTLVRREYEFSIGIHHPNIVNVFTYEKATPVGPGMVMEYIDGRTLAEFLAENPPMHLRRRILDQLLNAVAYIHRKGIIHNDLKPENILVTRVDNTLKLIDFGLSENDAYFLTQKLGCTPKYASPELLSRSQTDSRSDIYSLGLLMRDILGGRRRAVWARAASSRKEKRYSNVEHMQRALSAPRKALSFLVPITLVLLIAMSQILRKDIERESISLKAQFDSISLEQKKAIQRTMLIDSLCTELDDHLAEFFLPLIDTLKTLPTMQECNVVLEERMSHLVQTFNLSYVSSYDPEVGGVLTSRYVHLYNKYYMACLDILNTKVNDLSRTNH